jgi:hypothetical protein
MLSPHPTGEKSPKEGRKGHKRGNEYNGRGKMTIYCNIIFAIF